MTSTTLRGSKHPGDNGLPSRLEVEADQICGAERYERSPDRVDTRARHYDRTLETKAGAVTPRMPNLWCLSVRRVEDITETLWGTRVNSGTMSRLNQKNYRLIKAWRNREITGDFPYACLDGVILKRSWAGVKNVSVPVAIGVGADGYRQILGFAEGEKEDLEGWRGLLRQLKDHGLKGVQLIISHACRGLIEAVAELYPKTDCQRCVVHLYRNVFSYAPNNKAAEVARMLKAIHAREDRSAAAAKSREVAARLKALKLKSAADLVDQRALETLTYHQYPCATSHRPVGKAALPTNRCAPEPAKQVSAA